METEFGISTVINQENFSLAKSVCAGIKEVVSGYKRNSINYKAQLLRIQDNLSKQLAAQRMQNSSELYTLSMKKILDFSENFDVARMDRVTEKIYYAKLEKLNDELDSILDNYSKSMNLRR